MVDIQRVKVGVARHKSPSYPRINLERAIELTGKVYDQALGATLDVETVTQLLGFQGSNNGAARAVMSSLKQFGLIEGRDDTIRVTPLATTILQPLTQHEKAKAIQTASQNPKFYSELRSSFIGRLPSDQVLKASLIRQHGFNPAGADAMVKILRETIAFSARFEVDLTENDAGIVELGSRDASTQSNNDSNDEKIQRHSSALVARQENNKETARLSIIEGSGEKLIFRLSPSCTAELRFDGATSQSEIDKLIAYLQLARDSYPEQ